MVKAALIVNIDSPLPPGVTFDVPYSISGEGEDTMLYVDTGRIVHGVDVNRMAEGIQASSAPTPAEINKRNGYDQALAECESLLRFKNGHNYIERRDACFAQYPHLREPEQESADFLSKEKWDTEQAILLLKQQLAEREAELAEINRQLATSRPDDYED